MLCVLKALFFFFAADTKNIFGHHMAADCLLESI